MSNDDLLDVAGVDFVCNTIEAGVYIFLGLVVVVGLYAVGVL